MKFSINYIRQTSCLCAFLWMTTFVVEGKAKIETPKKRIEKHPSKSIPVLRVPFFSRNQPSLPSKPLLPLSLDPIRFTLQANKAIIAAGEEIEITVTAQLIDIPTSAFFIFEEQKSFSIKLIIPEGFTQTGGDYYAYCGAKLSAQNGTVTKHIRGVFSALPENPCFVLLRGALNANANGVFEQKQVLCLAKKVIPKATRKAECTPPALTPIAPQTICYGGAFYLVGTNVTNSGGEYYQWYNDNGLANNNTDPIVGEERANLRSFPTAPGVYKYKVVVTSAADPACSASQNVTLTVNALPVISSTTGSNPSCSPIVAGTISIVGAGGSSLLYSKDNGGNWVNLTGINAQNEITRNTLLYTTEKDVARVKITLENGFGIAPGGEYTGEISSQMTAPIFDGLAAGTYSLRVKNENGCISAPTNVTLTNPNAPAIFSVSGGGTCVSNGASINLSSSSTGVNYYLFRNGTIASNGLAGTGGALSFGNQTAEGSYTVMSTNTTTNCSAQMTNNAFISSGTPPEAPVNGGGDKIYCAANMTALNVSVGGGQTADWYATPTGGASLNGGTGSVSFIPATAGVYYVETRDVSTQCKSSSRTPVKLHTAPTLSIAGNATIGCESPFTLLSAQTSSSFPVATSLSYAWKKMDSSAVLATTPTFNVSQIGTYALSLTYEGCTLTSSQAVSSIIPEITLANTTKLGCGGAVTLVPTLTNTNANTSYEWSGPDGFTDTTTTINVTKPGTYTLLVKNDGTIPCGTKEIFVEDKPQTPINPELTATRLSIDPENSTKLIASGCASSVRWSYVSNDPPTSDSATQTPLTLNTSVEVVESASTPELLLSYQTTPFQTSATYTAACVSECGLSTASIPITIFKNICVLTVKADANVVPPNTPVSLVAFGCEPANVTWSTGQTGERVITVMPTITTTYFAVCKILSTGASCSSSVKIKVSDAGCSSNFSIAASTTSIQKGESITLTANGCADSLTWSNGVQKSTTIKVYPTDNVSFYATCVQNGKTCYSNTIYIQTQKASCLTGLYSTGVRFNKDRWSTSILPLGCENGTLVYSHQGVVNQANKSGVAYLLNEISGNVTVTATCTMPDGTACSKTLTINQPSKDCNNLTLAVDPQNRITASNGDPFILTDDAGIRINQTAFTSVRVPVSVRDRFYTAVFPNGCQVAIRVPAFQFKIRWKSNLSSNRFPVASDLFDATSYADNISSSGSNGFKITMDALDNNCTGQIIWTNDQDPNFRYEGELLVFQNSFLISGGVNVGLPYLPIPTTTTSYYATCFQNGVVYPATNSKTLVVNALGGCLTISRDAWQITHGSSVTLKASGCLGQISWTFNGVVVGTGNTLTHTPILTTTPGDATYTAACSNSACSQTVKLKIQPCSLTISAPKTLVKIAEPLLLTAQGCLGGSVNWNTGEIGRSITVKPLASTTYSATCVVGGQTLCQSENLAVSIDNQPPADIECPSFTLQSSLASIDKCTQQTVIITPSCPSGSYIIWEGLIRKEITEPYSVQLSDTKTITATCTTIYGLYSTKEITITAVSPQLTVSPSSVVPGYPVTLTAYGCNALDCTQGAYSWKNLTTGVTYSGQNIIVKLADDTQFEVSCNGGTPKTVNITILKQCEEFLSPPIIQGFSKLKINANTDYNITWYRVNPVTTTTIKSTEIYKNVKSITVPQPVCNTNNFDPWYKAVYVNASGVVCTSVFTVLCKNGSSGSISSQDPTTADPCNEWAFDAKIKVNPYETVSLYCSWCPGKVRWYSNEERTIQVGPELTGGAVYILGKLSKTTTFYDRCTLPNGVICEGSYTIKVSPKRVGTTEAIATTTAANCPPDAKIDLAVAIEQYLAQLICQTTNLYQGSNEAATQFLADLKAAITNSPQWQSYNISFPSDNTAIINALVNGNCQQAASLLAAPNVGSIGFGELNSIINAWNTIENSATLSTKIVFQLNFEAQQADTRKDCSGTNRTGNIEYFGTLEHWLIQYDYISRNFPRAFREYQIPQAGANGGYGYADLAVPVTGELFEIKQSGPTGLVAGRVEVKRYVDNANIYCKGIVWKQGTNYETRYLPMPRFSNTLLEATLTEPGVIQYKFVPANQQPQPVYLPQDMAERIKNWVERTGKNAQNLEREIIVFLRENPDVATFLKAAAYGAAAGIVVATIVEDIVTLGAGIADDWASFAIAYRLVRVAQLL